jgi:hypothetical protein
VKTVRAISNPVVYRVRSAQPHRWKIAVFVVKNGRGWYRGSRRSWSTARTTPPVARVNFRKPLKVCVWGRQRCASAGGQLPRPPPGEHAVAAALSAWREWPNRRLIPNGWQPGGVSTRNRFCILARRGERHHLCATLGGAPGGVESLGGGPRAAWAPRRPRHPSQIKLYYRLPKRRSTRRLSKEGP